MCCELLLIIPSLFLPSDDHSRVYLEQFADDPGSDYINANFIDVCSVPIYKFIQS